MKFCPVHNSAQFCAIVSSPLDRIALSMSHSGQSVLLNDL